MKKLFGGPGTVCGLLLRIGQCASAAASIGVMVSAKEFSVHTAFCYLIASMGLQLLWSFGLTCLDVYALRGQKDLQNPILVSLFVVGDWVTAMLSLAAACSSAGVVVLYEKDVKYCNIQGQFPCLRYEIAVALRPMFISRSCSLYFLKVLFLPICFQVLVYGVCYLIICYDFKTF